MKLTFDVLEVLDAIDRTGTFTAAAELLHRVPSSLTYVVQKLENDLAIKLFDRSGRKVKLTHAGRVVVEEGRGLLYAAAQLEQKARRIQNDGWEPDLRICVDECVPFNAMWPYVAAFYELNIQTHLRFSHAVGRGPWDALLMRRADLIVSAAGELPKLRGIATRHIGTVKRVFAVSATHPLARVQEPLTLETVRGYREAVVDDCCQALTAHPLPHASLHALPDASYASPQPLIALPALYWAQQALGEGLAAGFLPAHLAARAIDEGRLVARRIDGVNDLLPCYLAWREGPHGKALQWWIEQLDQTGLIEQLITNA
jgi:DNA-binding transcriptional LysR family regulator